VNGAPGSAAIAQPKLSSMLRLNSAFDVSDRSDSRALLVKFAMRWTVVSEFMAESPSRSMRAKHYGGSVRDIDQANGFDTTITPSDNRHRHESTG
jgi:hypothetical protein